MNSNVKFFFLKNTLNLFKIFLKKDVEFKSVISTNFVSSIVICSIFSISLSGQIVNNDNVCSNFGIEDGLNSGTVEFEVGSPETRTNDRFLESTSFCTVIDVKVFLEGPYQEASSYMTTFLNEYHLLPGQDPTQSSNVGSQLYGVAAQQGQPYNQAPWYYTGTEGDKYGDRSTQITYPSTVTDWILVSIRDNINSQSPIWQCAALLHKDGKVTFPEDCPCLETVSTDEYYIVIEHRNHFSSMSQAVTPVNGKISFDFTTPDSWKPNTETPQKVTQKNIDGTFVMYAGNIELITDKINLNSFDNSIWIISNGNIFKYRKEDLHLDGDVNSFDKAVWNFNNGQFQMISY